MASAKHDKDLLWEELNLGSLVSSMKPLQGLADRVSLDEINKSKVLKKHNDIVQKPTYGAIMDRYQALPHKPKSIQAKKLDTLADPIRGRFSRIEKFLGDLEQGRGNDYPESSVSPSKRSIKSKGLPMSPHSPRSKAGHNAKQVSGFFLTGEDDNSAEPDNESQEMDARANRPRKGLAAALRSRVVGARKGDKVTTKGLPMRRTDPLAGKQKPGMKGRQDGARPGWTDNTHVNYLGKNKGVSKRTGVISEDYKERRDLGRRGAAGAGVGVRGNVPSSGYGNSKNTAGRPGPAVGRAPLPPVAMKARPARLMKRLTGTRNNDNNNEPAPGPVRKAFLRSKSTIDLPDPPRGQRGAAGTGTGPGEMEADDEGEGGRGVGVGHRYSDRDRLGRAAKVQSAPAQLPARGKAAVPSQRRGPVDAAGRAITLDGLARVPNRKLSPLRPLPEQRGGRRRAGEQADSPNGKFGAAKQRNPPIPRQNNARLEAARQAAAQQQGDSESEREAVSPAARLEAQMAAQRAYNQQHDPLWLAQQAQLARLAQAAQVSQEQQQQQLQLQVQAQLQLQQLQIMQHQLALQQQYQQQPGVDITGAMGFPQALPTMPVPFPAAGVPVSLSEIDPTQLFLLQQQHQQAYLQQQQMLMMSPVQRQQFDQQHLAQQAALQQQHQQQQYQQVTDETHAAPHLGYGMQPSAAAPAPASAPPPDDTESPSQSPHSSGRESPEPSPSERAAPSLASAPAPVLSSLSSLSLGEGRLKGMLAKIEEVTGENADTGGREADGPGGEVGGQGQGGCDASGGGGRGRYAAQEGSPDVSREASREGSRDGSGDRSGDDGDDQYETPRHSTPPARALDPEEQLVEEMVSMDLESALARLAAFQQRGSVAASVRAGTEVAGGAVGYAKPGAVTALTKHAKSLSGHLNAAEKHLADYKNLASGLM